MKVTRLARGSLLEAGDHVSRIVGGAGNGATFTQTFVVNADTTVIGKGVGTALAAKGGKAPFTELITPGDKVSVSYHTAGGALHASDVRVVTKGSGSH